MNFYKAQIIKIFIDVELLLDQGIWYSGIYGFGEFIEYYKNGGIYKHCRFNVKSDNKWWQNKQYYLRAISNNCNRENFYKEYHEDGELKIEFKCNNEFGSYKEWYLGGQLMVSADFNKDGEPINKYKKWWANGQLEIDANYKNGVEDGKYRKWYFNGQLWIDANYKNGKKDGSYKEWRENGQLAIDAKYSNGEKIYRYEYDKNGNKL